MAGRLMHALQYESYGGGAAGLKHVEVPVPTPSKGEVLLKLEATSINPVDWKIQKGLLRPLLPPKFPFIPTTDVAGEVVEVGPGIKNFKPGDKVVAMLNTLTGGGFAEYGVAKESLTVPRPPEVSAAEGAGLPVAGLTAHMALTQTIGLKLDGSGPQKNILVTAASGGVGVYAVQLAKLGNAHVTATCGARNVDLAKSLGADEVLDYKTPEGAALKSPSGRKYTMQCFTVQQPFRGENLQYLVDLVKEGKLKSIIDSKFPLSKAEDAWAKSIDGHATGKIIVEPLEPFSLKPHLHALQSLSLLSTTPLPRPSIDAVTDVSAQLKKPNWQTSNHLKSLVSHLNPHLVSKIIASHSRDIPLCLKFFKWVCQQSTYCYDMDGRIQLLYLLESDRLYGIMHKVLVLLIKECCSSHDEILKLMGAVDDMREKGGFRINYPCYSMLLMCLAKLDMGLMAFLVFKRMLGDGFVASGIDYRTVVNALCKNGLVQAAEMFVSRVLKLGFALDVYTYTSLVLGNCRAGELGEAFRVFALMSEGDGCGVNSATYSILVHGLCEAGSPGTVTYNALINGYCKEGRVVCAFELLGLMERKKCKPTIRTYNELMEGLCKVGRPYKAVELLRKIINNGLLPTEVTFNILIDGFCRAGELNMAFDILHSMSSYGIEPNHFSYTMFIDSLCKMERLEHAGGFLGMMIKKGIFLGEVTLTALIDGYCKTGNLEYALSLFEEMVENRCLTSPHTFNIFLDVLGKEVKLVEVNAMFGYMLKHGLVPSVVTYTILVDGLCRAGEMNTSLKMLELMKQASCPPNIYTYTVVIKGLCQSGKLEDAEKLLIEMQKAAVSPNVIIYAILVKSYVAAGRLNCAFDVVSAMFQDGCRPNSQIYSALLAGILESKMDGSTRAGNSSAALNAEAEIGVNCFPKFTFMKMDIYHAFQFLNKIRECGGQPFDAYKFLIMGLAGTGRISEADILIQELVKYGLSPDSDICSCIITHFCNNNDSSRSLEWITRFHAYGCDPSFASYSAVIVGLQNEGRLKEAERLISDLLRNAGVEDQNAISPYIDFLRLKSISFKIHGIFTMGPCSPSHVIPAEQTLSPDQAHCLLLGTISSAMFLCSII
ncbi:UNVERIFIED_CONTAM: Quinone-oxidoreductase QR1, chloroplastic [Sesamum radiatum]|uniref:Quinone-oxidoreductase QR1, chloroplastic n=1 Tax=Sesamum radiatum TaxID=300843 RepID=A0AAW2W547_SESRA